LQYSKSFRSTTWQSQCQWAGTLNEQGIRFDETTRFQSKVLLDMKSCRFLSNRPEVLLRNDDLLMPLQQCPLADTSLCCKKRELLPFVKQFEHKTAGSVKQTLVCALEPAMPQVEEN